MRRLTIIVATALVACGARSSLIVPPIDVPEDAADANPGDAPPLPTACTWTPMGAATQLSDSAGAWHLEDVALAPDRVLATWHAIAGGDVLVARVGFGGERLEDAHPIAPGQFTAVPERVTQLAIASDHAAAFTLRTDGWVITRIGIDGASMGGVFHVNVPSLVRAAPFAPNGYTALTADGPEPRVLQLATIDDTGSLVGRLPIISPSDMLSPIYTRAMRDDGSFLVAWSEQPAAGTTRWVQAFATQGTPRGPQNSFPRGANEFTTATRDGYLMLWTAPRSASDPSIAMWAQPIDAIGALVQPASPVDTGALSLRSAGPLGAAQVGADIVSAYVENDQGNERLALQSLDALGHAQEMPTRTSSYRSIGRIVVLATPPMSAAVIFEATPNDAPGTSQVYGLGLTCLR